MTSNKIDIPFRKTKEHDNDEGFEETQSLMSESPSQGASSGGNYEHDSIETAQIVVADYSKAKPQRNMSIESKSTESSTKSSEHITPKAQIKTTTIKSLLKPTYNSRNLERSSSLRKTSQDNSTNRKSVIPRRSESLKKNESTKPLSIQKSNSRNSIVSSRSSLNSATSTSTVKKLPLRPNTSNNINKPIQRTPSNKSVNSTLNKSNLKRTSSNSNSLTNRPPRPHQALSFMKPTAASATKQNNSIATNRSSSFRSK